MHHFRLHLPQIPIQLIYRLEILQGSNRTRHLHMMMLYAILEGNAFEFFSIGSDRRYLKMLIHKSKLCAQQLIER